MTLTVFQMFDFGWAPTWTWLGKPRAFYPSPQTS